MRNVRFTDRDGRLILDQRLYNMVHRSADLAGITLTGPAAGPH